MTEPRKFTITRHPSGKEEVFTLNYLANEEQKIMIDKLQPGGKTYWFWNIRLD
jgi:hypothetical protein